MILDYSRHAPCRLGQILPPCLGRWPMEKAEDAKASAERQLGERVNEWKLLGFQEVMDPKWSSGLRYPLVMSK